MAAQADSVLARYAALTSEMLALAQSEAWDAWLALGEQRDQCFAQLSTLLQADALNEQTRAILVETLQRNQQMEGLVADRHHELADLLHSVRQQQKISSTYR
jgi:hypothetical protein